MKTESVLLSPVALIAHHRCTCSNAGVIESHGAHGIKDLLKDFLLCLCPQMREENMQNVSQFCTTMRRGVPGHVFHSQKPCMILSKQASNNVYLPEDKSSSFGNCRRVVGWPIELCHRRGSPAVRFLSSVWTRLTKKEIAHKITESLMTT